MLDICLPVDGCSKLFVLFVPIKFAAPSKKHVANWKTTLELKKGSVIEAIVERKHELLVEFTSSDFQKEGTLDQELLHRNSSYFQPVSWISSTPRRFLEDLHELRSILSCRADYVRLRSGFWRVLPEKNDTGDPKKRHLRHVQIDPRKPCGP